MLDDAGGTSTDAGPQPTPPHATGFPQQPTDGWVAVISDGSGQYPHCDVDATDLLIASQKAFPNESSAHAIQLDGSPEQVAEDVEEDAIGKIGRVEFIGLRRRRGTGAWYSGRLSRIDDPSFAEEDPGDGISSWDTDVSRWRRRSREDSDKDSCSDTCCMVMSLHTHEVVLLQNPQERGPPSNNVLFVSWERSNMLLTELPIWTSRGEGIFGNGEKLVCDEL